MSGEPIAIVRDGYLTRAELASYLHVSERTIARWQAEGLPAEVWGRRLIRYQLGTVRSWLDERKAA